LPLLPVELHNAGRIPRHGAQFLDDHRSLFALSALGSVLLFPLSFLPMFFAVSYLDAALDLALVDLRPGLIETLILTVGEIELFPRAVACGDQYMDMRIVGIGVEGVEGGIGFELRRIEPLPGHAYRLVPIHGTVEAEDGSIIAPLSPALLGIFAQVIGNAAPLIFPGDAEVLFIGDVAGLPLGACAGAGNVHGVGAGGAGRLADGDLAEGAHAAAGSWPGASPEST
jgi:hypothetical protein